MPLALTSLLVELAALAIGGHENAEGLGVAVRLYMLTSALVGIGGLPRGGGWVDGGDVKDEGGAGELYFK